MLLFVRLNTNDVGQANKAAGQGEDIIILNVADPSRLRGKFKAGNNSTLGIQTEVLDPATITKIQGAGADFAMLSENSEATTILNQDLGFVMTIKHEISDVSLRMLEDLSLDAILVPTPNGPLTIEEQLKLRRISALSRTMLLINVAADITTKQLQALRAAGVVGVIIDAGIPIDSIRKAIDSLPAQDDHNSERMDAIVPMFQPGAAEDELEEE